MASNTEVKQVAALIKQGDHAAARERLRDLMKTQPQNADVYFLASQLVTKPEQRVQLLERALKLDPTHKGAQAQLQMSAQTPTQTPIRPLAPTPAQNVPAPAARKPRRAVLIAGVGLVLVILVVGAFVLVRTLLQGGSDYYMSVTSYPLSVVVTSGGQTRFYQLLGAPGEDMNIRTADWSPDGARVAYTDRSDVLHVMNADGSGIRSLDVRAMDVLWSPDGSKIAYIDGPVRRYQVYVIDAAGGTPVRVSDVLIRDHYFTWSPDSTRLAFANDENGNLLIAQADGSGVIDTPEGGDSPVWSPDGKRLAYTDWQKDDSYIGISDADGSNPIRIGKGGRNPDWSPDGTQIAYNDFDGIYVMNADGTNIRMLREERGWDFESPTWSLDGKMITYLTSTAMDSAGLGWMTVDGTQIFHSDTGSPSNQIRHQVWLPPSVAAALSRYTLLPEPTPSGYSTSTPVFR